MEAYLTQHKMGIDEHAGVDDTSEVMFIDRDHKWVRKDKLAPDDGKMGVRGDPTQASTEFGKMFIEFKIKNAVTQIRSLTAAKADKR
jgi:creatinine amidohydrolase/Fe(II)-dependent formamide hydrolase-like protein